MFVIPFLLKYTNPNKWFKDFVGYKFNNNAATVPTIIKI